MSTCHCSHFSRKLDSDVVSEFHITSTGWSTSNIITKSVGSQIIMYSDQPTYLSLT